MDRKALWVVGLGGVLIVLELVAIAIWGKGEYASMYGAVITATVALAGVYAAILTFQFNYFNQLGPHRIEIYKQQITLFQQIAHYSVRVVTSVRDLIDQCEARGVTGPTEGDAGNRLWDEVSSNVFDVSKLMLNNSLLIPSEIAGPVTVLLDKGAVVYNSIFEGNYSAARATLKEMDELHKTVHEACAKILQIDELMHSNTAVIAEHRLLIQLLKSKGANLAHPRAK